MYRKQRKPLSLKGVMIIIAVTISVIVAGFFILKMNYLLPWQIPLFKDRMAIIKYAREVHPKAKIVKEHIETIPAGYFSTKPDCYIVFEEDGFQYAVRASNGEVSHDFYNPSKLSAEVRAFVNENFFEPRGIKNVKVGCDFGFNEYYDAVPEQWSEYNDDYTVLVGIYKQGTTPYEVGWIYDFYNFWNENMTFPPKWSIQFTVFDNADDSQIGGLYASYKSDFSDADDLYKCFYYY